MSAADRDCWMCGAQTNRLCWCHDPNAFDGRWCRCDDRVHVPPSAFLYVNDGGVRRE